MAAHTYYENVGPHFITYLNLAFFHTINDLFEEGIINEIEGQPKINYTSNLYLNSKKATQIIE